MAEVVEPLARQFLFALNGNDEMPAGFTRDASAIFDRMIGPRRRREVDDTLGLLRANIRRRLGPDASEEEEGWRLALLILGHDPLAGSLAATLYRVLLAHPGVPLSEIDYPTAPINSSVAFAERVVEEPFQYQGISFNKGDRIRMLLQSFQYTGEPAGRMRMFGAGAHVCLGRQAALELWSLMAKRLSQIGAQIRAARLRLMRPRLRLCLPSQVLDRDNPMTLEEARDQVVLAIHAVTGALDSQVLAAELNGKNRDVALSELDLDSLAAMAVCLEIENGTSVALDLGDVASHPSVDGLAQLLAGRASANAG